MNTRSSRGKLGTTPSEEDGETGATSTQVAPQRRRSASANLTRLPVQAAQQPGQHEHVVVGVLRLLPPKVRERFCYVCLGAALIALVVGLYLVPPATVAGGAGVVALVTWLKRMFGR